MLQSRKGITPIIAIVLLLLITVAGVGVVWTQFQSLTGNPDEKLQEQNQIRNAQYSITGTESTDQSTPSNGFTNITIRNVGDVEFNLSNELTVSVGPDGNPPQEITSSNINSCYNPSLIGNEGVLQGSNSYECNTTIKFPEVADEPMTIEIAVKGVTKDTKTCSVTDSDQYLC